jgi:hypothetical protein
VQCQVIDGVVFLRGVVPSFHLKQVAQAVILRLPEVQGVQNALEVRDTNRLP